MGKGPLYTGKRSSCPLGFLPGLLHAGVAFAAEVVRIRLRSAARSSASLGQTWCSDALAVHSLGGEPVREHEARGTSSGEHISSQRRGRVGFNRILTSKTPRGESDAWLMSRTGLDHGRRPEPRETAQRLAATNRQDRRLAKPRMVEGLHHENDDSRSPPSSPSSL